MSVQANSDRPLHVLVTFALNRLEPTIVDTLRGGRFGLLSTLEKWHSRSNNYDCAYKGSMEPKNAF